MLRVGFVKNVEEELVHPAFGLEVPRGQVQLRLPFVGLGACGSLGGPRQALNLELRCAQRQKPLHLRVQRRPVRLPCPRCVLGKHPVPLQVRRRCEAILQPRLAERVVVGRRTALARVKKLHERLQAGCHRQEHVLHRQVHRKRRLHPPAADRHRTGVGSRCRGPRHPDVHPDGLRLPRPQTERLKLLQRVGVITLHPVAHRGRIGHVDVSGKAPLRRDGRATRSGQRREAHRSARDIRRRAHEHLGRLTLSPGGHHGNHIRSRHGRLIATQLHHR